MFKKWKKLRFLQRGQPMVLVQNWPFFHLFFKGILGEENVFYGILERKNAFLGYKNSIFKKWKICDFWKGVNPWFWSKIVHFSIFFQSLQVRKMCFTIVQNEKAPFQAIKTACSKSGKIAISGKGLTHGFGPKLAIFPSFIFLGIMGQENVFYDILERRNAFLGSKKRKLKTQKN